MNPSFRRDQMKHKPNPKCGPKIFIRRQTGETARRKEADDRPNGGYCQTNSESADHPFRGAKRFRGEEYATITA